MRNDVYTDTDDLLLQQLFETGSLALYEDTGERSPPGKPRLRDRIATLFCRKRAAGSA